MQDYITCQNQSVSCNWIVVPKMNIIGEPTLTAPDMSLTFMIKVTMSLNFSGSTWIPSFEVVVRKVRYMRVFDVNESEPNITRRRVVTHSSPGTMNFLPQK